jgi:hypothetical protein
LLAHRLAARQHGRHCAKKQEFLHCLLPALTPPKALTLPATMLCGAPACGQSLLRPRAAFPAELRLPVTKKHQRP